MSSFSLQKIRVWLRRGLACAAGLLCVQGTPAQAGDPILVITSRDGGPYGGVVEGLRQGLGFERSADMVVHSLETAREATSSVVSEARRSGRAPILTVGTAAARLALSVAGEAPVVACMIVDKTELGEDVHATGVMLEFPLKTQLEWIRRFVPGSESVGVLYNPDENSDRIKEAQRIAKGLGLRLVPREVHRPQDLPAALESIARDADLLFALTDRTVLSPQTAQAILLFSFRNRMPFSGLSASWVKAGALYSLERDYEDLGGQCAEMLVKVLKGKRPAALPPVTPRKVVYSINLKTAEHLKLRLSPKLVDGAAQLYR